MTAFVTKLSSCLKGGIRSRTTFVSRRPTTLSVLQSPFQTIGSSFDLTRSDVSTSTTRSFHATRKQEILPFIAAGGVVFVMARYSWKAWKRMDAEWAEYEKELLAYEKAQHFPYLNGDTNTENSEHQNRPLTIAIDLGTLYMKMASSSRLPLDLIKSSSSTGSAGFPYRFNGALYPNEDRASVLLANDSREKFYLDDGSLENKCEVVMPSQTLSKRGTSDAADLLEDVVKPVWDDVVSGQVQENRESRYVVTVAPSETSDSKYAKAFRFLDSDSTTFVPEPVAALWGAQLKSIIPLIDDSPSSSESWLVVDVGALSTSLSVVQANFILASSTIEYGAEVYTDRLAHLIWDVSAPGHEPGPKDRETMHSLARGILEDPRNQGKTDFHVPHADTTISSRSLENACSQYLMEQVVQNLVNAGDTLSTAMPTPTEASSLFTSLVTNLLEVAEESPQNLQGVLLVGGGAPLLEDSLKKGLYTLMGTSAEQKVILAPGLLRLELTALGAASMLTNHNYTYENGLQRFDQ